MDKQKGPLMAIVIVLVFVLVVIVGYLFIKGRGTKTEEPLSDLVTFSENAKKGEAGYEEKNTVVTSGVLGRYSGNLVRVEEGRIYLKVNDKTQGFLLSESEVVLQCTSQNLRGATDVDLKFVNDVKVVHPEELSNIIPVETSIFLLGELVEDGIRIHTLVIPSAYCPE